MIFDSPIISRLGGLVLLILIFSSACRREQTAPPPQGPAPVTVSKPVQKPVVDWDRYTGRFQAVESVEVRSRVSGYLESIHFDEGNLVKAGDLLFVIDERPFKVAVEVAKARVEESRAAHVEAKARLAQSNAESQNAEAQRSLARSRLDRAKKAATTNAIAREQVDVRESEFSQAESEVSSAKARIAASEAAIATANAAIATAETTVRQAELELSYCRVSAPIDGRIGDQLVTQGNLVDGGSMQATLLATIVSIDPIHCYFNGSEKAFLKYVRLNQEGKRMSSREVKNPAYASLIDEVGYPHVGHMDFVDNSIDRRSGTIEARAIFRNPEGVLTPGLFATVQIPGSARYEAIMIPDAAVGSDQSEKFTFVVDENNVIERRLVILGPIAHGLRVIRSGLKADDRVVLAGLQRVRPGMEVVPQPGEIKVQSNADGLPDVYEPVPRERWIERPARRSATPEAK